ncbi:rhodanese-like domain-containing protein [Aquibium sp. ELW1220]|uniref:rhodanese-like domain-containing protein n=1 Tax=Aquibium sp. ELW1220 TaxID=2976766 RepID=UPI0025AF2B9F|nr:rhodanese-like domain-containing protein [Aquibium sp. ELW1220]MDN2579367.1 rhodanese-like domain-containing protein [Aquibium sp. ELW1220]
MPKSITCADLSNACDAPLLIDVRKGPARAASGLTIPDSLRGEPERVAEWARALVGRTVVVFCVHGHEVSRDVANRLAGLGVDCRYLDGGFAAWQARGNPVEAIGADV